MDYRRRELLFSLVSVLGAAVLKLVWDSQQTPRPLRVIQVVGDGESGASSTFRIEEGAFTVWELSIDRPSRISYSVEVLEGPPIDVILSDDPNPLPEDRQEWRYYPESSRLNTRQATATDEIPPGDDYLLIFDNSNRLEASPPTNFMNDRAIVSFEFSLTPTEQSTSDSTPAPPTSTGQGA